MNAQIRELAEKAGFSQLDIRNGFDYNEDNPCIKFAELIVRECMRMCDVAQVGYLTHGHTLQGEGCQGAKRYISDWFEVEE